MPLSLSRLWRPSEERTIYNIIRKSGYFDREYYLARNPDVASAGHDPLMHFIMHGAREGRSPSATFDIKAYLKANPAAATADTNPVVDWIKVGEKGGRRPPTHSQSTEPQPPAGPASVRETAYSKQEVAKYRRLAKANQLFSESYYLAAYPDILAARIDPFEHYLRLGHYENRNPSPEFDTHFYRSTHGHLLAQDWQGRPFAHFLEEGRALGLQTRPDHSYTLAPSALANRPAAKVAVHLHLFYPEMAERFFAYLSKVEFGYDLFITTCSIADKSMIERIASRSLPSVRLRICTVPNRGRDIAPFLFAFPEIWEAYDFVLHLHSKRSSHISFGGSWLDWILRHLLGDPGVANACLDALVTNKQCAMLFPDNYCEIKKSVDWNDNQDRIRALLDRLGVPTGELAGYAHFAAGSMGWFRVSAFRPLAEALTLDDFEVEESQLEGTLAHVLERVMPVYASRTGLEVSTFYLRAPPPAVTSDDLHARASTAELVTARWMRDTPSIARQKLKPLSPRIGKFNPRALEISWIIPDFPVGAGGHMTIFRIVEFLDRFGHRQTIWIQNPVNHHDTDAVKASMRLHYRNVGDKVAIRFLPEDVRQLSGDVLIATDCWTVFPAVLATDFKERFYFIQDYEPYFHPAGENYLTAESTYRMGLAALCAGEWLAGKARSHGMWTRKWELASDPEHYFPGLADSPARQSRAPYRIVFYNRSYTPRRAVKLGLAAFEELGRRRRDFEVLMFGEPPQARTYSFPHQELGILTPAELGELYRRSQLGVSFSTTNYSLVPLEMMACDLPVVEIDTESTRAAFPEGVAQLASPDPIGVADAIERLLDDEKARSEQIARARRFVSSLGWEKSAKAIEAALLERLAEKGAQEVDPAKFAAPAINAGTKVSVIIPTLNGGETFKNVLTRVASQNCAFSYDVLVIDSSSVDGTAEFVKQMGGRVRLHTIEQKEFQHGRTRNLAISMTEGDMVAVLTQDATPADDHWLSNLIAGFERGPKVAGVIGRHRGYPTHNPLMARDLERMFDRFADIGPIFSFDVDLPSHLARGSVEWRMIQHFYSDNNSAMLRSVWQEFPYPEVEWGEDQIWAWDVLKLGFSKVYADDAVVFHSHDSPPQEQLKVAIAEGRLFAEYFGYNLHPDGLNPSWLRAFENACRIKSTKFQIPQTAVDRYVASTRTSIEGRTIGAAEVS